MGSLKFSPGATLQASSKTSSKVYTDTFAPSILESIKTSTVQPLLYIHAQMMPMEPGKVVDKSTAAAMAIKSQRLKMKKSFLNACFLFQGIQIVIGSMHIGFGIILGLLSYTTEQLWGFASLTFLSGYPFWGGICVSRWLGHLSLPGHPQPTCNSVLHNPGI